VVYLLNNDRQKESFAKVPTHTIESKQKIVDIVKTQPEFEINKQKTKLKKVVPLKRSIASSKKKPTRSLSSTFKSIQNNTKKEISELRNISQGQFKNNGIEFLNGLYAERVKRSEEPVKAFGGFFIYDSPSSQNSIGIAIKEGRVGVITGEIAFQTKNIKELKEKIHKYNAQVVMNNRNIGIFIVKVIDSNSYEEILTSSELKSFNPKPDVVFDYKKPR
jgi:hypothetical protein